jgi:hypothetical protein
MTTLVVATIVMQQPTCFWRISNLGDNNILFFLYYRTNDTPHRNIIPYETSANTHLKAKTMSGSGEN